MEYNYDPFILVVLSIFGVIRKLHIYISYIYFIQIDDKLQLAIIVINSTM